MKMNVIITSFILIVITVLLLIIIIILIIPLIIIYFSIFIFIEHSKASLSSLVVTVAAIQAQGKGSETKLRNLGRTWIRRYLPRDDLQAFAGCQISSQ